MGDIKVDWIKLKEASKKKKDGENIAKAARKKLNEEKKRNKDKLSREICKATMKDLSEKEEAHTSKLTVPVLKGLIQFVFWSDEYKQTDIQKPGWVVHFWRMYAKYLSDHLPTEYSARISPAEEEIMVHISSKDEDDVHSDSNNKNEACHDWCSKKLINYDKKIIYVSRYFICLHTLFSEPYHVHR